jgi:siroheme synthase (precorrin-2 oxidase/ferrochelatase)
VNIIPPGFHGESVVALVVGGGRVGTRRALALLEGGARVRVIAPTVLAELRDRTLAVSAADGWRDVSSELIDEDFCDSVESATFAETAA